MIHLNIGKTINNFVVIMVCCVTLNACKTQNNTPTFSGTLIDVEGKPIAGHIVTIYPIEMSETGSAVFQPITTIVKSPGFLTARTKNDGSFAFTEKISQGMVRINLMSTKLLDALSKPKKYAPGFSYEYELISVKIGVMTFNGEGHGPGSITFSLLPDRKYHNVVIVARQEMWIEGKVVFNNKKPLADSPVTFKINSRLPDKSGVSRYNDRIHSTDAKGNFWLGLNHHNEPKLYKVSLEYQGLTAESREFLLQGGSQHKGLILKLNGNKNDIPANPKPPTPVLLPGMQPLPTKLTPQQWLVNPYNRHAYVKVLCQSIDDAKAQADAEGAYLVAVNDVEEQEWLSSIFGNKLFWIGLHRTEDGQWRWDSDEPVTFTNWGPEDRFVEDVLKKDEKAAVVMTFVDGEWHAVAPGDLFWDYTKSAILEKDSWHTGTTSEDR